MDMDKHEVELWLDQAVSLVKQDSERTEVLTHNGVLLAVSKLLGANG